MQISTNGNWGEGGRNCFTSWVAWHWTRSVTWPQVEIHELHSDQSLTSGSRHCLLSGFILSEQQFICFCLQLQDLKKRHMEEALCLFQQLHRSELDLWLTYQMQLSTRLYQMVAAERDSQLAQLEKVHNQNVAKQKKKQELQNWDEMKALAKKHKDKSELARSALLNFWKN